VEEPVQGSETQSLSLLIEGDEIVKLLTKELEKKLPALYSQKCDPDPQVVAHFFNPTGQGDWYITEGSYEGDDYVMFGLCYIHEAELGYVSLNELKSVRLRFGLGIERDRFWHPKPLSAVKRERGWS
jgi:hypothetical protein